MRWDIYRAGRFLKSVDWEQDYVRDERVYGGHNGSSWSVPRGPVEQEAFDRANQALVRQIAMGARIVATSTMSPSWAMETRVLTLRRMNSKRGVTYAAVPPLDLIFDLTATHGDAVGNPEIWANHQVLTQTLRCFQGSPTDPYAPQNRTAVELDLADPEERATISRESPELMVAIDSYIQHGVPDPRMVERTRYLTFRDPRPR